MKNKFKKYQKSYLIRPMVYRTVTKVLWTAVLGGIWNRFCNKYGFYSPVVFIASIFTVVFAVLAWVSFLRLDGMHLPRINRHKSSKKKIFHTLSDITDHLDSEIIPDEELDVDERDFCSMVSSLICCILCFFAAVSI